MPERLARLRGAAVPSWVLGLVVGLLTFPIYFGGPGAGLDASWGAGLYMAVHDGLDFGPGIVYTYGPLGFLFNPVLWYDGLATISFLFGSILWLTLAISLVWSVRRSVGALPAVLIAFVTLALLPTMEYAIAIAVIWSLAVLHPDRPRFALEGLIVAGAAFAAIEILIKLSVGPVVLAVMGLALIGARARPRQLALFAAIFAAATTVLWLATGNALGDLVDYVTNGREIISGYSEAMAAPSGTGWQRAGAFGALVLLIAGGAFATYRDGRARLCGTAIAAIAGFALFKEGVVRSDEGHMVIALSTMVALWLAIPWEGRRRVVLVGGFLAIGVLALKLQTNVPTSRLNPIDTVKQAEDQAEVLFSGSRRDDLRAFGRSVLMDAYDLDPETLAALEGHSVSIDPWEVSVAWVYDFDWAPVPVFQNYQAYTDALDELNAAEIASPDGPERILRENPTAIQEDDMTRGVDDHYPSWDPPAQALATLCNFEPLTTTEAWQVLGRVPDRCGEPELVESVDAAYGDVVPVPAAAPGEVVFARIEGAGVGGLEKLRSMFFRARFRYAVDDEGDAYRFVPGTAEDGLLLDGSPGLVGTGPWEDAPRTETISLVGIDGELRYDFYSMAVDAPSDRSAADIASAAAG